MGKITIFGSANSLAIMEHTHKARQHCCFLLIAVQRVKGSWRYFLFYIIIVIQSDRNRFLNKQVLGTNFLPYSVPFPPHVGNFGSRPLS